MGCALIYGKSIGRATREFNIEMAELGAEARGMTLDKLYRKIPRLLEAKRHREPVDALTQYEASILLGFPIPFFYRRVRPRSRPMIACGPKIVACKFCGEAADYRCDAPIGDGRTCDLPLCTEHKQHRPDIGSDTDYCPHHIDGRSRMKTTYQLEEVEPIRG